MAQRPLPRLTIAVGVIVAMLTVPLATPPAMAAVDLVGDDDTEEEESEGSDSAEPEQGDAPQNEASSSSSDGNLGQALGDVVNSVTAGSDEQQAAADGEQPQEVAPEPQAEPEPGQSQPQGGGGSGGSGGDAAAQPQGSGPQPSQQAGSGEAPAASQPPAPSGPRQATRPAVNANGQPPPAVDSPSFDSSIDPGGQQPQAPEVFSEPSTERNQDVAALPSIPLLDESADSGAAVVPNHLVAAAAALAVVLAAAHSLNATRRFASGRVRRHDEETEAGPLTREG